MSGISPERKAQPATHAALAGLGVLRSERARSTPLDVLRRIVEWRDRVHDGGVVRGSELEALIEEARALIATPLQSDAQGAKA